MNLAEQAAEFRSLSDEQYKAIANGRVSVGEMLAGIEAARREKAEQIARSTPLPATWASGVEMTDALAEEIVAYGTRTALAALTDADRAPRADLPEGILEIGAYDYSGDGSSYEDSGYKVVQIDTENPGRIRVYVNDGVVYDADPEEA